MIATSLRPTAKILQFPSGAALASAAAPRDRTKPAALPRTAPVVFGSSWYHDAAILEARDPGKN